MRPADGLHRDGYMSQRHLIISHADLWGIESRTTGESSKVPVLHYISFSMFVSSNRKYCLVCSPAINKHKQYNSLSATEIKPEFEPRFIVFRFVYWTYMQMISTYNKYIMFLYSDMAFKNVPEEHNSPNKRIWAWFYPMFRFMFWKCAYNQILHLRTCSIYKPCIFNKLLESGIISIKKNY